jgi:hypothetical protein
MDGYKARILIGNNFKRFNKELEEHKALLIKEGSHLLLSFLLL